MDMKHVSIAGTWTGIFLNYRGQAANLKYGNAVLEVTQNAHVALWGKHDFFYFSVTIISNINYAPYCERGGIVQ